MNKRGFFGAIIVIIFSIFIILIFGTSMMEQKILDQECEDMGLLRFEHKGSFDFCEAKNGNLHYIKYDCDYRFPLELIPKDCSAVKIKIGEVGVK